MRKMGPLWGDHALVRDGTKCPACQAAFIEGDYVTLIEVGPGTDSDARKRAREGRPYSAVAIPVHWACATGEET